MSAKQNIDNLYVWDKSGALPQDAQKKPDFSHAQPWRAETRLSLSKSAASSDPQGYAEGLNDARTPLAVFFSIL
jgi:hypothetical protein